MAYGVPFRKERIDRTGCWNTPAGLTLNKGRRTMLRAASDPITNPITPPLGRRAILTVSIASLAGSALSVATLPANAATALDPDAELFRLGGLLTDAWHHENQAYAAGDTPEEDDAAEQAQDVTRGIVLRILDTPARTLNGLLVKMRAFSWCHCGEPFCLADISDCANPCTDVRLLGSIITDLAAMRSAQA